MTCDFSDDDEEARLRALDELQVFGTPPEPCFDDIVGLAAALCAAPMAAVTLVGREEQWLKASCGTSLTSTPRSQSVCSHLLRMNDLLVIPNALEDPRFRDNPLVQAENGLRFYAGAPLRTSSGHVLGALCILDVVPRAGVTPLQAQSLRVLAAQVVAQLELRRSLQEHARLLEEQRRAQEALAHSEERYRLTGEVTHDVFWELDVATGKLERSGRRVLPEDAARTMESWIAAVHPDEIGAVLQSFQDALASDATSWSGAYRMRLLDRPEWGHIEARARIIRDEHGVATRVYGTLLDVTQDVQLREQIAQNERLASIGVLSGGVAHEMNNPLSYVLSNLRWLRSGMAPGTLDEDQAGALDDAVQGAERLQQIVADLRAFAQDDGDARAPVDVVASARAALTVVRPELPDRAVLVESLLPVPPADGCAARLTQVVVQLLRNAAQALRHCPRDDHRIFLRSGVTRDQEIFLEVEDTGEGMTPEIRRRIFDPFFTTRPTGSGRGLGLSVCHGLVKRMGGDVEVESTPGKGTRIRVVLTASEPRHPDRRPAAPSTEAEATP